MTRGHGRHVDCLGWIGSSESPPAGKRQIAGKRFNFSAKPLLQESMLAEDTENLTVYQHCDEVREPCHVTH